jgi:hypothetical protein
MQRPVLQEMRTNVDLGKQYYSTNGVKPSGFVSGVYNPPTIACKFINVSVPHEWMKFVIGRNGYYFNAITRASKTSYIWYHAHIKMIEVRGPMWALVNAERRLVDRMEYIRSRNEEDVHELPQSPTTIIQESSETESESESDSDNKENLNVDINRVRCEKKIVLWADVEDDEEF